MGAAAGRAGPASAAPTSGLARVRGRVAHLAPVGVGWAAVVAMVAALAGCSDDGGSTKSFCRQVRNVPVITDRDQLATPDASTATDHLLVELRRLRASAPADIRRDVTVMVTMVESVQRAMVSPEGPERNDAINEIERQTPAWGDASNHVVSYTRRTCGFDLVTPS